jgi:hypothetical protein
MVVVAKSLFKLQDAIVRSELSILSKETRISRGRARCTSSLDSRTDSKLRSLLIQMRFQCLYFALVPVLIYYQGTVGGDGGEKSLCFGDGGDGGNGDT